MSIAVIIGSHNSAGVWPRCRYQASRPFWPDIFAFLKRVLARWSKV